MSGFGPIIGTASGSGTFYDPGARSPATGQFLLQLSRLTLSATETFALGGTARLFISDFTTATGRLTLSGAGSP